MRCVQIIKGRTCDGKLTARKDLFHGWYMECEDCTMAGASFASRAEAEESHARLAELVGKGQKYEEEYGQAKTKP